MLRTGFDSMYSKENDIDIDSLEKSSGIKFPDAYKLFLNCYRMGRNSLRKEFLLDDEAQINVPLVSYYFGEGKTFITIDDFIEISQAIELRKTDAEEFSESNLGLMRIAFTNDAGGGGIYIGLNENNFGKIYKVSWDFLQEDDGLVEIAEDIFDFVKGLKSSLNTLNGVDFNRLFKNWDEDFWRIR